MLNTEHRCARRACKVVVIGMLIIAAACTKSLPPDELAAHFWAAVQRQDHHEIKTLISQREASLYEQFENIIPIAGVEINRVTIEKKRANAATIVTLPGEAGIEFPLDTHMVKEDGRWKIAYQQTIDELRAGGDVARMMEKMRALGSAIQDGIDRSVEEIENTLPRLGEELSRLEQEIRGQIPAFREHLEIWAKQLEESLQQFKSQEQRPPAKGAPI